MMSALIHDEPTLTLLNDTHTFDASMTATLVESVETISIGEIGEIGEHGIAPAFSSLVERFGDEIYRFSWHLARNQADADDLYQETLFKAFKAYERLPWDANHRAWLYRIASNTFISDRRKRSRDQVMTDVIEQTATHGTPDHARGLDARDLLADVEVFVQQLPTKQRIALIMRKYQGAEYAQIADALACTEVAARANVHEALRKLRANFAHRMEI